MGLIVKTLPELQKALSHYSRGLIAVDVETYKQRPAQPGSLLLGVSCTFAGPDGHISFYIPLHHYDKIERRFKKYADMDTIGELRYFLEHRASGQLIGWNVPFDKAWLDYILEIDTNWHADGRVYWHLQNNDPAIRGFGLKKAQQVLLKWSETNEKVLEEHVKAAGGSLKDGHHYLADLDVLSHYACLDTLSTFLAFEKLSFWVKKYEYKWFADKVLAYSIKLYKSTSSGLSVDVTEMREAQKMFKTKRAMAATNLRNVCFKEIEQIEEFWLNQKLNKYKSEKDRNAFKSNKNRHKKFNPSSGPQRALLLHQILKFPILERTPTGRPKTDRSSLALIRHPSADALREYSEYKKLYEFASSYLESVEYGRLYAGYDVCGTVSGRLSGFRPNLLAAPFGEADLMKSFKCEEGYVGIHADLAAIEPCVLAHYSEDPTLLKVYKNGLGDIYLDLGLDIFSSNAELKRDYNPNSSDVSKAKVQFKDIRSLCKIIHLAVSYTGTYITVAKNLTKAGFPTSKGQAMQLVSRYWQKFSKVKDFSYRLTQHYREVGQIRNIVGRIIQVPREYEKDLLNRLVQSSAHDILVLWVEEIINLFNKHGVEWKYWIPDIHDSTTFMVKAQYADLAKKLYGDALRNIENQLELIVPLKAEVKFCTTLAGLKGE